VAISEFEALSRTLFSSQCFLVWDCLGSQMLILQFLKLCGAINYFGYSGFRFPFSLLFDLQPAFALRRIDISLLQQLSDCTAG
jgi:hypothetical protein